MREVIPRCTIGSGALGSPTKEEIKRKYVALKVRNGGAGPSWREFLAQTNITQDQLQTAFGPRAFTKLQEFCGDESTRLVIEAVPLDDIMESYGALALETIRAEQRLPQVADWQHKKCRPSVRNLRQRDLHWRQLPLQFERYCKENSAFAEPFDDVLEFIAEAIPSDSRQAKASEAKELVRGQEVLVEVVQGWAPARRRNVEESYKSELSQYLRDVPRLKRFGFDVREERGDSLCDIVVGSDMGIEAKKPKVLGDYDRCFGQVARHLEGFKFIIVLILDAPRRDEFEDFCKLVDEYFGERVRVIKNG